MSTPLVLREAADRANRYLADLDARGVAPSQAAIDKLGSLDEALPLGPSDPMKTLELLDDVGSPATTAMAGRRFFGFVIGGSLPVSLAANWLAGAWDQNSAYFRASPATAYLEQVALRWLLELLGLPSGCGGAFVTGATVANLTALAAARGSVLKAAGWNVEADGLFGAPPITVIVGDEVHPSVTKSLGVLGMGRTRIVKVPVDGQGRMRSDRFPPISGPTIVCLQAGNVNTGASDPIAELCEIAHSQGAWVHLDGAFGLWAAASPALRSQIAGYERVDSWATDAHKWLNVPYDSGLAFVRDPAVLRAAMSISADYLPSESVNRNPSDFVPELSRRARGVEIWAVIRSLGKRGIADLIERNCRQARRFAEILSDGGCTILNEVVLNQVLVGFGEPDRTSRVIEAIQRDGTCWCGSTVWQGKAAMRISVSSWATQDEDVERSAAAILKAFRQTA